MTEVPPTLPFHAAPIRKTQFLRNMSRLANPPVDSIEDVSDYVYLYRTKHQKEITLNRYEKAVEAYEMMESFSRNATRSLFNRRCQRAITSLGSRLSTTSFDREILASEMGDRLNKFDMAAAKRLELMRARHSEEWERHCRAEPIETPAKFRRRSPNLIELCRQERRMFAQGRFDEAAAVKKQIDKLESQESKDANQQAMDHWQTVGRQLREKFRREEDAMMDWITTRRGEIVKDQNNQDEAMMKRESLLGRAIDKEKSMMRKSAPYTIRRNLIFDRTKSRGTAIPRVEPLNLDKLCQDLPEKAKTVLMEL